MLNKIFIRKTLIEKGWSEDKKYFVSDVNGNSFLLRVSSIDNYESKKKEFEFMKCVEKLNIPMCRPLEFGVFDEGVYSIQTWIDGLDAKDIMPIISDNEQYSYGLEGGKILRKIHSIQKQESKEDWERYFNRKIDYKIKKYLECPIKYDNGQIFIDYINNNRYLLKNRPQTYQHGDYHIGNMMIDKYGKLYIIDFNRNDFGDPWEEFKSITWSAQKSPLFSSGLINGYFDNNVPLKFWKLSALYISIAILTTLPWSISFGAEQIKIAINQAKDVLDWYDDMRNPIPKWYGY